MKEKFKKLLLLLRCFTCLIMVLGINLSIHAQGKVVTGTVVDATGAFLPGVNIIVKGKNVATVSDINGKFSIKANEEDVLTISSVGYLTQEIKVGNQTSINVSLAEDVKQLNEVVVIGYGVQKKSDLTGAVSSVSAKDLSLAPVASIDQALQGHAAGVQISQNTGSPGSSVTVRIRGVTSVNNLPVLWVVDGVPADPKTVNPNDIESMEVLKDASTAAIYGAQARGNFNYYQTGTIR